MFYVVQGAHYWGAGSDLITAKRNMRAFGGRLSHGYTVMEFDAEDHFLGIDGMGYVNFKRKHPPKVIKNVDARVCSCGSYLCPKPASKINNK
jgi:hypothetical protein